MWTGFIIGRVVAMDFALPKLSSLSLYKSSFRPFSHLIHLPRGGSRFLYNFISSSSFSLQVLLYLQYHCRLNNASDGAPCGCSNIESIPNDASSSGDRDDSEAESLLISPKPSEQALLKPQSASRDHFIRCCLPVLPVGHRIQPPLTLKFRWAMILP